MFWNQQAHIVIFILLSYIIYCTFHCVIPHCAFFVFLSFLLIALESRFCPIKRFILVSKKFDHSSVKHMYKLQQLKIKSDTSWVTYYIHCISKLLLFSLKFSLKQVFLSCRQIHWKMLVQKFVFLTTLLSEGLQHCPKMCFKHFQRITLGFVIFRYFLTFSELLFPRILFQ